MKDAVVAGGSDSVEVEVVLAKVLEMFPTAITQKEKQFVRFTGNHYAFLPYTALTQTTVVTTVRFGNFLVLFKIFENPYKGQPSLFLCRVPLQTETGVADRL